MEIKQTAKRILTCSLAALMLAGTAVTVLPQVTDGSGIKVQAATPDSSFEFRECIGNNGSFRVYRYTGYDTNVVIPSRHNNRPVKELDAYSFQRKDITSVVIPDSVTKLGSWAFCGCKSLKKVTLPKTNEDYVGSHAFEDCTSLTNVTIPNGWTYIPSGFFTKCESLTSISLPSSVKSLKTLAFENCYSLKNVNLGRVESIENSVFKNCTSLKTITIPSSVKETSNWLFDGCSELTDVYILSDNIKLNNSALLDRRNKPMTFTIHGNANSAAQSYAKAKGYKFVLLPTKIALDKTSLNVTQGSTATLKATVTPANNSVSWSSSDNSIATVSGGKITAKKAGTATIKAATVNGKVASCKVTVIPYVVLNKTTLSLGQNETFKLTANKSVTWRTSNSKIVTVDKNGNIKAVGKGKAWVTAKAANGAETACTVTVKSAPSWVKLNKGVMTLKVGQTGSLSASIPSDAACAKRTFRTSNSSVVKMTRTDWTGSFKAVKPGTAYVTVRTYNGKEASCKITVTK